MAPTKERIMSHRFLALAGVLAALPLAPLAAQSPVSLSVAGGASVPVGAFGDAVNTGWHATAALGLSWPMQPISVRLEGGYHRLALGGGGGGYQSVIPVTANIAYRVPSAGSRLAPYVIAGLGAYRFQCSSGGICPSATKFGWNAGVGTKLYLLGFRSFLEARYEHAGGAGWFPVSLGFTL
jgi:hypothetical protein